MNKYKFRAECLPDLARLFSRVPARNIAIFIEGSTPDCVVTFDSAMSLESIIQNAKSVVDGHVIAETVSLINEYTGVRE